MNNFKGGVIWDLWEKGGLDMKVQELPTGLKIINTTPHSMKFIYKKSGRQKVVEIPKGENDIVEGFFVDTIEQKIDTVNEDHEPVVLVKPTFIPRYPDKVKKALEWAEKKDVYFVGSILSAMAIKHKRVVSPIVYERKSAILKSAYIDKFTTFWENKD